MTTHRNNRPRFTKTQRLRLFAAANGICHICGLSIKPGEEWEVEHKRARCLLGEDREENYAPAHIDPCHRDKTRDDMKRLAKARRQAKAGMKQSKHPLPCGRGSLWKKKFDGRVMRRS